MKELTIEQKAKRYDEALEMTKSWYIDAQLDFKKSLETLFPELKESEDEKVRKEMIEILKKEAHDFPSSVIAEKSNSWIAWLEKQVPIDKEKVLIGAKKDVVLSIMNFLDRNTLGMCLSTMECKDLEDAVLDSDWSKVYAYIKKKLEKQSEQKPADKVESKFKVGDKIQYSKGCGTIMTIEKIENGEYIFGNNMGHTTIENGNKWYLVSHVEQNTAWSEEDEKMLDFAIRAVGLCKQYAINHQVNGYSKLPDVPKRYEELQDWLKSIKNRVQPKQQWSEEDERYLSYAIHAVEDMLGNNGKNTVTWLKCLKDRYTWKPSDEQMCALWNVYRGGKEQAELAILYNDLKKLRRNSYESKRSTREDISRKRKRN